MIIATWYFLRNYAGEFSQTFFVNGSIPEGTVKTILENRNRVGSCCQIYMQYKEPKENEWKKKSIGTAPPNPPLFSSHALFSLRSRCYQRRRGCSRAMFLENIFFFENMFSNGNLDHVLRYRIQPSLACEGKLYSFFTLPFSNYKGGLYCMQ